MYNLFTAPISSQPNMTQLLMELVMTRIALVTGGTRGIGAASCILLKAAGYKVVAVYHGNDQVAERFKRDTGIPVYKWDVASYDACVAGLKRVEARSDQSTFWSTMQGSHVTECSTR
jgi:NAD(P)-dependent dehydrogenase (short-subunit alcohol dehydrogenase family)